ncbi:MAG TPA: PfkB family carbohydrate kinase [Bacteroidales bacterium]|nr:carbohydrate kinase [Bacteroidales bacterium]HQK38100.1 PfkB family carbohydrate kinase [Bacteroidales bacterium]
MQRIITLGETVLDIIFRNGEPKAARPGGAMLNTSITLGRLGLPVTFISEYGKDEIGNLVDTFLRNNGVDTSSVFRFSEGKTAIALAFLDEQMNAAYSFYKDYPAERLQTIIPDIRKDDLFAFGSFFAITREIRKPLSRMIRQAQDHKTIIYYDPNFRKAHLNELDLLRPVLKENFRNAMIVRGSHEDFRYIFGAASAEEAFEAIGKDKLILIYTQSAEGVTLITPSVKKHFDVPAIKPVSTIGAGDTFNAGILYGLVKHYIGYDALMNVQEDIWTSVIETAIVFAGEVCMSYDNYISSEMAQRFRISL